MRIGVLANQGSWYAADLRRAACDRGHDCGVIDFRSLCTHTETVTTVTGLTWSDETVRLNDLDAVIVRTMPPGSLEQVVYRMDALAALVRAHVNVINSPRAIECAVDKFLTTSKLAAASIPAPATLVCETVPAAMGAFDQLGRDVVVKPLFGAEGRGIVRVTDKETAFRVFKTLARTAQVLYLQRFIDHGGSDIRVLVLDGRPIAAMRRESTLDFRTNVAQSALASPHEPTDEERDLAVRATAATGARIAGVDLIRDPANRAFVPEVNAVPGWRALARVTGIDVAACLIGSIERAAS